MSTYTLKILDALSQWRDAEKRHGMAVLGRISASEDEKNQLQEIYERALNEVRKSADDMPVLRKRLRALAKFNEDMDKQSKKNGTTPKARCVHRGYAEGIRECLIELTNKP